MKDLAELTNILVIRLSSLGDVVLTTPVFTNLRRSCRAARISVLTKAQYQEVFAHNPDVDEVIALSPRESLWRLAGRLRTKRYDLVIDLHGNLRSHLLGPLLGAPVISYNKLSWPRYLLVHFHKSLAALNSGVIERYLATLKRLKINVTDTATRLYLSDEEKLWAEDLCRKQNIQPRDTVIGINPGAKWQTKKWPFTNWIEFLKMCKGAGVKILMFGDQPDKEFTDNILSASGEYGLPLVDVVGTTNLRQLMALVQKCHSLVTTDSGTMHIAQALKVPVVVLLGPTVREFGFVRAGANDRILAKELPCRPCSLHGSDNCKRGDQICLASIKPEEVFQAVKEQLKI